MTRIGFFRRLALSWRHRRDDPPVSTWRVEADEREIRVTTRWYELIGKPPDTIAWEEVHEVAMYLKDLWSCDQVRVFFARREGSGCEIHEDMLGYREFIEQVSHHLTGFPS